MSLVLQSNLAPPRFGDIRALVAERMRARIPDGERGVYQLVSYHLGWTDEHGCDSPVPGASGKLLRPILCVTAASGYGTPRASIGAAAAIEFLHAFSLVHDDIEDADRERRHRATLWALPGIPLAINAGDSLFALAHSTLVDACRALPGPRALLALRIFDDASVRMIEGQHRDIEFESRKMVSLDEYRLMAEGKTGALIGAALALGGLFTGAPDRDVELLREAGVALGLAFQAVDDVLSQWGDPTRTGKPSGNDLARGKKSLPVVLHADGSDVPREASLRFAREHASIARAALRATTMSETARAALDDLIRFVLDRES